MPPWKKLTLCAVNLEESYFHQFQVGFLLGLSVILLTPCMIFPWSQPIYQNVLEIYLEVDFYIAWLCCKYPLRFHTCHDYTTLLYNSFFRKMFFPTLDLELILLVVRKSKTASRPTEFMVHGKVLAKRVRNLVTENLKRKWEVYKPFFFYSRTPSILVRVIRTPG